MPIKLFKLNATYFFLTLGLSSCTLLDNSVQQILTVDSDSDLTEDGTILPKELAAAVSFPILKLSFCLRKPTNSQ